MPQVGSFLVTNRVSGQKTLNPGVNHGNTSFANAFIYEIAQVENVVLNEDSGADSLQSRTAQLDRTEAAKTSGRVQFRIAPAYQTTPRKDLPWADPLIPYQSMFPIIGEYVLIFKAPSISPARYFYIGPVNISRNITTNAAPVLGDTVEQIKQAAIKKSSVGKLANAGAASITGLFKQVPKNENLVNYKPAKGIQPLKAYEGDVIIQGRYGNSIRLGSSQMHQPDGKQSNRTQYPNMIFRVGQADKALKTSNDSSGLTIEDLQGDASSIYLTTNEALPFKPSTKDSSVFLYSVASRPGAFTGAQIIASSDSIILNTKAESIFLFSKAGIHLNSLTNGITLDTEGSLTAYSSTEITLSSPKTILGKSGGDISFVAKRDTNIEADRKVIIKGAKIYLGGQGNLAEPIVLGTTLKAFFLELLNIFLTSQPWTVGPSGIANPAMLSRLTILWAKYQVLPGPFNASWASNDNFAMGKANEQTAGALVKI